MKPTLYKRLDFAVWQRIHRLPRFFVEFWQERELKRTVLNAYNNISLYRDLLDKQRIDPESVRLKDMKKLPITSKKLFRQYPIEKWTRIEKSSPRQYTWRLTSGCTGEPFRFPTNSDENLYARFGSPQFASYYSHRYLLWEGILLKFFNKKIRIVKISHADPKDDSLYIPVTYLREKTSEVFSRLQKFRPLFVYGRVTSVVELARLADTAKFPLKFPFAYVHGEKLTETQRLFLEKIFSCRAYNGYGLEEVGEIAVECRFHKGLHIYEESCIFEVLNEKNENVRDGEIGRIAITHFFNDMMPVIRYETTDYGRIIKEKCECGLRTPRLFVEGREGVIISIGGKRILPAEVISTTEKFNVLRYQIVKVAYDRLEVRITPAHVFDRGIREKISEAYLEKLGVKADVKIVNDLPYFPSGKDYFFIDETNLR